MLIIHVSTTKWKIKNFKRWKIEEPCFKFYEKLSSYIQIISSSI